MHPSPSLSVFLSSWTFIWLLVRQTQYLKIFITGTTASHAPTAPAAACTAFEGTATGSWQLAAVSLQV
jgi:hypothetical protein